MTSLDTAHCLRVALDATVDAGPIALEHFRRPIAVADKRKDGRYDPVTEADRGIETFHPSPSARGIPGPRHRGRGARQRGQQRDLLGDRSIDGTRAFISGMPTWGILLGLVAEGRPLVGVMHQPFTGETWYAAAGSGARLRVRGHEQPLRCRADASLGDAVLYSTHPSMFGEPLGARYEALATRCRLQRWGGDCYAFALVAQGGIDLMVDAGLAPYDILPLVPIIEEAGGTVTDLEGRVPLAGGTVIAAANAAVHAEALSIMSGSESRR